MRLTATAVAFSGPAKAGENPQGFKLWDRSCTEKLPRAKALQFLCLTCALNHRFRQVIKKRCLKKHHPKSQHGLVCKSAVCPVVLFRDRMVPNCLILFLFCRSATVSRVKHRGCASQILHTDLTEKQYTPFRGRWQGEISAGVWRYVQDGTGNAGRGMVGGCMDMGRCDGECVKSVLITVQGSNEKFQ